MASSTTLCSFILVPPHVFLLLVPSKESDQTAASRARRATPPAVSPGPSRADHPGSAVQRWGPQGFRGNARGR
eukprot:5511917-Pyramimonas_sp.AAC.1